LIWLTAQKSGALWLFKASNRLKNMNKHSLKAPENHSIKKQRDGRSFNNYIKHKIFLKNQKISDCARHA